MQYISVANWERFQQYKDRDPKWIKLYRDILDNYEFAQLDEISQAHLIKIWLLAAKLDNKIPYDPGFVSQRIGAKSTVDLETLVNAGFMRLYSSVQNCTNLYTETEKETEGETEKETETEEKKRGDSPRNLSIIWSVDPSTLSKPATMTRSEFDGYMNRISAMFGKRPGPEQRREYALALQHLDADRFDILVTLVKRRFKFFPSISELLDLYTETKGVRRA